jgi:hypothetical protein
MISRPGWYLAPCLAFLLPGASATTAQTVGATTGAIDGTVTDRAGAPLAGASVTVAGEALMVPVTAVTASDGSYRFAALPPGTYGLSFSRPGFELATRQHIQVRVDVTATVDVTLDVTHAETIVVRGAAEIDRRSTAIATAFDPGELARLPGDRTWGAILAATPAVQLTRFDVGGSTASAVGPFSVYGTSGFIRPTIDGISITRPAGMAFALDYGSFAGVWVGTGAYGPEWPTPGVHLQFITKSGGNRYTGMVYGGYEDSAWQSNNIDDRQIAAGAPAVDGLLASESNRLRSYRDLNADIGGYVKKDRVWWYASAREHASSSRQVSFPVEPLATRATTLTGKGTWRVRDADQIVLFAQGSRTRQPIRLDGFLRTTTARNTNADSTSRQLAHASVWKGEWRRVVGSSLFIEVRAGQFVSNRAERPNGWSPRTEDLLKPEVSGGNRDWNYDWHSDQVNGSFSYFRNGPRGGHQLNVGFEVQRLVATETWRRAYPGDVLHVTQNGMPSEVYVFQTPSQSQAGVWAYALHAGDAWQISDRLALNPGLRFDRYRVFLPEQHHPTGRFNPTHRPFAAIHSIADWNVVAPRIGVSFDASGDGRTILKASYGHYWLWPSTELGFAGNPNGPVWWQRYKWADTSGDALWQPGEEFDLQETRGGEAIESIDPALKLGYLTELTGRVEREAARGLFIGTGVVWRGERQQGARQREHWPFDAFSVPLTLRDPGPDAAFGTPDDGDTIQLFELGPDFLSQSGIVIRNPPNAASDSLTWEVAAGRRFSRGWSAAGSFAHTWNRDHAREFLGQTIRANEYPLTPNDFIHTDPRGRHAYRNWSAKIHATWQGPWGTSVTPFLRHQSGQAFGRTLVARLNYGAVPVLAEPVGTRRQRNVTLMDVKVERDVWRGGRSALTPFVEVFNALNANPEQNVSWETRSFLRPVVIVPPRIVRVGFTLDW